MLTFSPLLLLGERGRIESWFVQRSYVALAAVCLLWCAVLVNSLVASRFSPAAFVRARWPGLAAAFLLTALAGFQVDGSFKVLADETNQVNTARSLFLTGEARGPTEGVYEADGGFRVLNTYTPKRPLLFPFLGQLLHHLPGERERALFRLNLIVLFALLLLAYTAGDRFRGTAGGLTAQLLVVGNPIVLLTARSAGFDLFSGFWLFASLAALYVWMDEPTEAGFAFLWAQLLLLAHIRYENFLYGVIVFGCLFLLGRLRQVRSAGPLLAATPLLLLPVWWQFALSQGTYENPEGVSLFGAHHFVTNAGRFLRTQLDFNFAFHSAFSDLAFPLFLVSALVLAGAALRGRLKFRGERQRDFFLILGLCMAANLVIFLSLVHGDVAMRISQRFFLSAFLFFSLAPLALLILPGWKVRRWLLLLLGAVQFGLYFPVAADRDAHGLYYPGIEAQITYLKDFEKTKTLVIAPLPDRLCALGYGAVRPASFNADRRWFLEELERGAWEEVVVFQEVDSVKRRILLESRLHPGLTLKRVRVVHLGPERYMKISRGI